MRPERYCLQRGQCVFTVKKNKRELHLEAKFKGGEAGWGLRKWVMKGLEHAKKFVLDPGANREHAGQGHMTRFATRGALWQVCWESRKQTYLGKGGPTGQCNNGFHMRNGREANSSNGGHHGRGYKYRNYSKVESTGLVANRNGVWGATEQVARLFTVMGKHWWRTRCGETYLCLYCIPPNSSLWEVQAGMIYLQSIST